MFKRRLRSSGRKRWPRLFTQPILALLAVSLLLNFGLIIYILTSNTTPSSTAFVTATPVSATTRLPTPTLNIKVHATATISVATTPAPVATPTPIPSPLAATTALGPTPTQSSASEALKAKVRPMLGQLWQTYKDRYVQQDGRVRDPQRSDDSTSEGEAYALLRAVWQDDRTTFDNVLNWSINNLQVARNDKLFAYLWGKGSDNVWKVLDPANATDADQDIAFALLLAAHKWNDGRYQNLAQAVISDIWSKTVVTVEGQPYLTAGDWAASAPQLAVLNPSYFAPYEYRLFAQVDNDKSHNWLALVDSSYAVIKACTENKLDMANIDNGKLPPDWCSINRQNGSFASALTQDQTLDSDYGYDAFRTVWRLALDYQWNGEKRAYDYLQSLTILSEDWKTGHKWAVVYNHAGQAKNNNEDLGVYGGAGLGLFSTIEPNLADQILNEKILPGLANSGHDDPDPAHIDATKGRTYYAQNWVWFGLALYAQALPKPNS